jgi:short-subunit dehydrogenase
MAKSVLITGSSRGLGEGLARQFAARGYRLALTGRSMADLEQLRDELREMSPQVCIASLDVGDYASIASTLMSCAEQLGGQIDSAGYEIRPILQGGIDATFLVGNSETPSVTYPTSDERPG